MAFDGQEECYSTQGHMVDAHSCQGESTQLRKNTPSTLWAPDKMLQCSKFLQHALPGHASMEIQEQGTELEGNTEQCTAHITTHNMKEHLNRTACGFFNSNCSTPAGSSSVPHDPIMSCFLLACLLMNHQGKHFPARRMQEAGSGTARRLPLEDSLLSSHGRKEGAAVPCACQHPRGFTGA